VWAGKDACQHGIALLAVVLGAWLLPGLTWMVPERGCPCLQSPPCAGAGRALLSLPVPQLAADA
jgi:hypothetical protein